jgi:CHC2 zinc finger
MISESALDELKTRDTNRCDVVAGKWVSLHKRGQKMVGPCPICGGSKGNERFEATAASWVCAVCQDGGDVIRLVMQRQNLDFRAAVEWLGGAHPLDPVEEARRNREREEKAATREAEAQHFRDRERGKLYDIWNRAVAPAGTAVEAYLSVRGLPLPPDAGKRLRCAPQLPYFAHGGADATVLWRGPAMVAPIVRADGKFSGLHFTYLDPSSPKGKARIANPETGEIMPAKKVRGSKAGGFIPLIGGRDVSRLIIGEGIETVLSVWHALASSGRDLGDWAFWSAVDIGNLGGKAAATIAHPKLVDARGRARRVPGPEPDLDAQAITLPDSIEDVVLLGDGDSDPVLTACALYRAQSRLAEPKRVVRVARAPDGTDFNDILTAA